MFLGHLNPMEKTAVPWVMVAPQTGQMVAPQMVAPQIMVVTITVLVTEIRILLVIQPIIIVLRIIGMADQTLAM